jgi:hypothetical protein
VVWIVVLEPLNLLVRPSFSGYPHLRQSCLSAVVTAALRCSSVLRN